METLESAMEIIIEGGVGVGTTYEENERAYCRAAIGVLRADLVKFQSLYSRKKKSKYSPKGFLPGERELAFIAALTKINTLSKGNEQLLLDTDARLDEAKNIIVTVLRSVQVKGERVFDERMMALWLIVQYRRFECGQDETGKVRNQLPASGEDAFSFFQTIFDLLLYTKRKMVPGSVYGESETDNPEDLPTYLTDLLSVVNSSERTTLLFTQATDAVRRIKTHPELSYLKNFLSSWIGSVQKYLVEGSDGRSLMGELQRSEDGTSAWDVGSTLYAMGLWPFYNGVIGSLFGKGQKVFFQSLISEFHLIFLALHEKDTYTCASFADDGEAILAIVDNRLDNAEKLQQELETKLAIADPKDKAAVAAIKQDLAVVETTRQVLQERVEELQASHTMGEAPESVKRVMADATAMEEQTRRTEAEFAELEKEPARNNSAKNQAPSEEKRELPSAPFIDPLMSIEYPVASDLPPALQGALINSPATLVTLLRKAPKGTVFLSRFDRPNQPYYRLYFVTCRYREDDNLNDVLVSYSFDAVKVPTGIKYTLKSAPLTASQNFDDVLRVVGNYVARKRGSVRRNEYMRLELVGGKAEIDRIMLMKHEHNLVDVDMRMAAWNSKRSSVFELDGLTTLITDERSIHKLLETKSASLPSDANSLYLISYDLQSDLQTFPANFSEAVKVHVYYRPSSSPSMQHSSFTLRETFNDFELKNREVQSIRALYGYRDDLSLNAFLTQYMLMAFNQAHPLKMDQSASAVKPTEVVNELMRSVVYGPAMTEKNVVGMLFHSQLHQYVTLSTQSPDVFDVYLLDSQQVVYRRRIRVKNLKSASPTYEVIDTIAMRLIPEDKPGQLVEQNQMDLTVKAAVDETIHMYVEPGRERRSPQLPSQMPSVEDMPGATLEEKKNNYNLFGLRYALMGYSQRDLLNQYKEQQQFSTTDIYFYQTVPVDPKTETASEDKHAMNVINMMHTFNLPMDRVIVGREMSKYLQTVKNTLLARFQVLSQLGLNVPSQPQPASSALSGGAAPRAQSRVAKALDGFSADWY